MKKIDRFKSLIRYCKENGIVSSQKDLGVKLGYQNESSFSQVINGKVDEPKDFINRLCNLIPELNKEWLMTGEGSMLRTETAANSFQEADSEEIRKLKERIKELEEQNAELREDKKYLKELLNSRGLSNCG